MKLSWGSLGLSWGSLGLSWGRLGRLKAFFGSSGGFSGCHFGEAGGPAIGTRSERDAKHTSNALGQRISRYRASPHSVDTVCIDASLHNGFFFVTPPRSLPLTYLYSEPLSVYPARVHFQPDSLSLINNMGFSILQMLTDPASGRVGGQHPAELIAA